MASIPLATWTTSSSTPVTGDALQGGATTPIQGSSPTVQGSSPVLQAHVSDTQTLQPTANPNSFVDPTQNTGVLGATTQIDPAQAAADAAAAAKAAQAAQLRDQISQLASQVKDIYNGRYGQVDQSAVEQTGKLNDRFKSESGSLTDQIGQQNEQTGAAEAANGAYDSSYRGNAQDTITKAGTTQIDSLGKELSDNLATIAQWVQQQKAGFDAGKGGMDTIVSHLADETDPAALTSLRNQIDNQIASLKGQAADNNTESQNISALEQIAPSSTRAQQLQTTLKSILGGNADPSTKAAIAGQLIASADIPADDQSKLLQGFHADLAAAAQPTEDKTQQ